MTLGYLWATIMQADVLYVGVRGGGGGGETVATMGAGGSRVARDARQEPFRPFCRSVCSRIWVFLSLSATDPPFLLLSPRSVVDVRYAAGVAGPGFLEGWSACRLSGSLKETVVQQAGSNSSSGRGLGDVCRIARGRDKRLSWSERDRW